MNEKKKINLNTLKKSKNGIRSLRQLVFDYLGNDLFEIISEQEFIFQVMKGIYPINRTLKNEVDSIEKACHKLFSFLPIIKGTLFSLDDDGTTTKIKSREEELTPQKIFLQTYLQLERPPGVCYRELQVIVKSDLEQISNLIKYYESTSYIQSLLSKNTQPKNHDERIEFDFYKRCLKEQRVIIDYYLNGLKKRAIAKANYWFPNLRSMIAWTERFRDRPYYFAAYSSYPYFDCREIDLIANKVSDFAFSEDSKLQKLYMSNKTLFYRKLFKKHKPLGILQELDFYLSYLPLANDRKPIFTELGKLFKTQRWIGYYSLALTQIEGLFSEMYLILNPASEFSRKALPDKVEFARPYSELSNIYFDYYQYHIPRLRNKFMHYGFDEDFKLKSFDLLLDLRYLLKIFYELKNPFVKITKLHRERKYENFITYSEFASYFELINKLDSKQRKAIESDIRTFEKDFLMVYCNAEYVCLEVAQNLPGELTEFHIDIKDRTAGKGKTIDFSNRNFNALKESILSDLQITEVLNDYYCYHPTKFEILLSYNLFLTNFKKQLPSIDKEYVKILDEIIKKEGILLKNIILIKEILPASE
jgi:hypothetical protein